ncbi:sensor histidine kinase [Petroclostridium xylanilyticum]|uniref:sensor histidine kinase n=1 Tax=Petroclostridium xylanilyticum TaxID=1792311 RepID=UPI000B9854D9|nr:sensor histidine kinase [Petroclostridium xylanilyticum]
MNGKRIYKFFIGMPLKVKLILFSALQIFIPVIVVGAFSYNIATHILTDKVSHSTIITLEQAARSIELFMKDIEDLSVFLVSDDSVQKLLKKENESDKEGTLLLDQVYKTLFNLTNSKEHISFICILKEQNGRQYYAGPPVAVGEGNFSKQQWYKKTIEMDGRTLWVDTYKNTLFSNIDPYVFSLSCTINDIYRIKKRLGVLLINIKEQSLYQFYGGESNDNNREVFIVNKEGLIVSHRDKGLLLTKVDDGLISKGLLKGDKGVFTYQMNHRKKLVTYYKIPKLDWILVSVVSMNALLRENKVIGTLTLVVVMVSIVITLFLSILLASTISRPVGKLLEQMKQVSEGNFDIYVDFHYGDEVSQLGEGFNSMVKKIEQLIHQVYLEQKHQKEIELKALQAQINPHFLYNTLESINWMAQEIDAKDISTMVKALAKFFRISISKGRDIIDIKDEIEHVKNYLIIQKIRYQDVLQTEIMVSGDILNYKIPKLTLQPLVENSIYHGIKNKKGKGTILITGRKDKNDIVFEIIDNGIGMDEKEIERLNHSLRNYQGEVRIGYGIRNVHERIVLRFGKEYGLTYFKNIEGGITVEIRLPACTDLGE